MEVDGKEFLRNVGIEQDKERLNHEQQKLEELKRASVKRNQNYMDMDAEANEEAPAFVDLSIGNDSPNQNVNTHNQVDDIIQNHEEVTEDNMILYNIPQRDFIESDKIQTVKKIPAYVNNERNNAIVKSQLKIALH